MDPSTKSDYASPETAGYQFHTSKYIRHSNAIGILWGIFTVCTAILNIVAFVSEQWVGDTSESKGPGHFGLWKFCTVLYTGSSSTSTDLLLSPSTDDKVLCLGELSNFSSILSPAFRASTIFVGFSVILIVLSVLAFILFCLMKTNSVFEICGTMQFLAGICLAIGILAFPAGWDNDHVRSICGSDADDYDLGTCGIRWAYVLAIISFFDCFILGCLAFTLAHRVVKMQQMPPNQQEPHYMNPASIYKGEVNSGFIGDTQSLTGSRKSLSLQPIVMMPSGPPPMYGPNDDVYSERSRSIPASPYGRAGYGQPNIQNFQL